MHEGVYNFCLHRFYWNLLFKTKVCWFELYLAKFFHWLLLWGGGYLISIAYWLFSLNLKVQYKLGFSEKVVVDGHGCHTALKLGVKAKENKDNGHTLDWLPKLYKTQIKQDSLQIKVLVR